MPTNPKNGLETLVNTTTAGSQNASVVTALSDGGWVVTWVSDGQDESEGGIYQQRFSSLGVAVGEETRVNTTTLDNQSEPAVTKLADGGWVVTWTSDVEGDTDVFQQRFAADGTPVGEETQVNTTLASDQSEPSVSSLSDGGWVVVWTSDGQDGSATGIYQQRFAADGTPVGGETEVNAQTWDEQVAPTVVGLPDGTLLVTWSSFNAIDGGYDIVQRRYMANGEPTGGEATVNTTTLADQIDADVTVLPDGGWLVTWTSYLQDGAEGFGIFQQRFGAHGAPVGDETQVNTTVTGNQLDPTVTALPDGSWVVTWANQTEAGYDILQQRFSSSGVPFGGEELVNTTTAYDQLAPDVTTLADGGWVVTWSSAFQDGSNYGVYQQRYSANAAPVVATAIADQAVAEDNPWSFKVPDGAFTDADGDPLTFTATLGNGSVLPSWLTFDADTRTFTGTPPQDYNGSITLKVTASDGKSNVSDTFNLVVTPVNDAPVAVDDTTTVAENSNTAGSVLENDSDVDGDKLTVVGINGGTVGQQVAGQFGTLTLQADGSYTYTPTSQTLPAGQQVTDTFTYTVSDGHGGTDTANIAITVTGSPFPGDNPTDPPAFGTVGETVGDFNGNNVSDLLFRNTANGNIELVTTGPNGTTSKIIETIEKEWTFKAVGDIDGDGNDDVVFRNTETNQIGAWIMRHDGLPSDWRPLGTLGEGQDVKGIGDFNDDGFADILIANTGTGQIDVQFQGKDGPGTTVTIGTVGPGWSVAGVGDFDENGTPDILFYNSTTRHIGAWEINDGHVGGWFDFGTLNPDWEITGVGNFNGSGPSDINFYNSVTGEDGVWVMNNGNISSWMQNASHDNYSVMGVGPGGASGNDQVFWNNPINGNYYTFEPR